MNHADNPATDTSGDTRDTHPYRGLTFRSALFGIGLSALINIAAPYSKHFLRSTYLASDFMPLGLVFPFLFIVTVINGSLKAARKSWGLSQPELIVVFTMGLVATTIPTVGLTGTLLTTITSPYYYATPENGWQELYHGVIPQWLAPSGDGGTAIRWFFEGVPKDQPVPWEIWVVPLFWWLSLISAVFFACICLVTILRKQWIEQERLPYPLVEVPILLTEEAEQPGFLPPFMRTRGFWIGCAIPLFLVIWNIGGFFQPHWPRIPTQGASLFFGKQFPGIPVRLYFPVLGFAYLINVQVALSIWLFYLLGVFQVALYNRLGVQMGSAEIYTTNHPALSWQGFGALIVMVGWGLWVARGHLKDVWRKAWLGAQDVDDSTEVLSYRVALFGLAGAAVYVAGWLYASGMSLLCIALFLPAVLLLYLAITRIVVEGGLVFVRMPMIAQPFVVYTLGTTANLSVPSIASLALSYTWFSDIKCTFMVAAGHASRLVDRAGVGRKAILLGIGSSVTVALGVSLWYTLYMGYQIGASNMDLWLFQSAGNIPFNSLAKHMRNPFDTDFRRLGFMGGGMAVMALLTFLRTRLPWWPLAPLGFPISSVQMVRNTALTIFIAWALKVLLLKIGGNRLYRRAMPFFFGLMIGYYAGLGLAWIVDFIWFPGGQGHYLYGV